jgi:hypothetical protein
MNLPSLGEAPACSRKSGSSHRVAIIQSNYIPWKGYFDIIHDVDLFIFLDDVQYTRRDWRSRNRIKTPRGAEWLSIPTNGDREHLIHDVLLVDPNWQKKHWKTLCHFYGASPFFKCYRSLFETIYLGRQWTHLSHLNQHLIQVISRDILALNAEFADSREYRAEGFKQHRIIDLLIKSHAGLYVSGPSAIDYLDEARFRELGIELVWKSYHGYPEYPQFHPPFEHEVTILDSLFQTGPDAPHYIWGWRREQSIDHI